jgi:hypothetical protein
MFRLAVTACLANELEKLIFMECGVVDVYCSGCRSSRFEYGFMEERFLSLFVI